MRVSIRSTALLLVLVGSSATALMAGDPPHAGSWKLNPAKSDFGETTVTYQAVGGLMCGAGVQDAGDESGRGPSGAAA